MFSVSAWTLSRTGHATEARAVLDELLQRRRANPTGVMAGYWTTLAALALERIGLSGPLAALGEPGGSRFLEVALAIDEGRYADGRRLSGRSAPRSSRPRRASSPPVRRHRRGSRTRRRRTGSAPACFSRGLNAVARLRELDAETSSRIRSGGT